MDIEDWVDSKKEISGDEEIDWNYTVLYDDPVICRLWE